MTLQLAPVGRTSQSRPPRRAYIEMMMPWLLITILLMTGLVVDGSNILQARRLALDTSAVAARSAAMEVDVDHLRQTLEIRIDQGRAQQQIDAYFDGIQNWDFEVVDVEFDTPTSVIVGVGVEWKNFMMPTHFNRWMYGTTRATVIDGDRSGN